MLRKSKLCSVFVMKQYKSVRDEDIREGMVVKILGQDRLITKIESYNGPLKDIVLGIANITPGPASGFSLCYGQFEDVVEEQ